MEGTERLRSDTPGQAKLYFEGEMRELDVHRFCGGAAAVFSKSNPSTSGTNEDAAGLILNDATSGVLVVADGAGGLQGGGRASRTTVEGLAEAIELGREGSIPLRESILSGIERANHALTAMARGGATTVAVAELRDGKLRPYHAGDSQILVFSPEGHLKYLTVSHSPTGYAVQMGLLEERQAMLHEDRHLLFNVVGIPDMRIEMGMEIPLEAGDTVLLACDGLFDNLAPDEVIELLHSGDLVERTRHMIQLCLERMGGKNSSHPSKPDDLTVVAFRFQG